MKRNHSVTYLVRLLENLRAGIDRVRYLKRQAYQSVDTARLLGKRAGYAFSYWRMAWKAVESAKALRQTLRTFIRRLVRVDVPASQVRRFV